jgi:hypothetical protein
MSKEIDMEFRNSIPEHLVKTLIEATEREFAFWDRHDISSEKDTSKTGQATPAHRAWVQAVGLEYGLMPPESHGRCHLDTPIARKAFILGFRMGQKPAAQANTVSGVSETNYERKEE